MLLKGGRGHRDGALGGVRDPWFDEVGGLPIEEIEDWLSAYVEDVDALDVDGSTVLHRAVAERAVSVVEVLSRWVADVDQRDRWGYTPLGRAVASFPWSPEVVALLVARGADPIAAVLGGTTAPPPPAPHRGRWR